MARRAARREPIFTHIYPLLSLSDYYGLSFKLIGINTKNTDGAKRIRTADPLHAMQVLYQLSYGPKRVKMAVISSSLEDLEKSAGLLDST